MDYDKLITKHAGEESLDYGIIFGNEKIVFIKSGADGNIKGENNKYLLMAKKIHARLGATVICASNPDAKHSFLDEKIIKKVAEVKAFANYEVYFVGNSDGAYKVLELAKNTPEAVAQHILDLYRDAEKRKSLGQAASEKALLFDEEAVLQQVKEIYLSM